MNDISFFNILDYFYIVIMLISTIFGVVKGFTRVFFSICAWIMSGFFSVMLSPHVLKLIEPFFHEHYIAQMVSAIASYIIILVTLLMATHMISNGVKRSVLSGLDRAAGALFGLIRGLLLPLCLCMLFMVLDINPDKFTTIRQSKISAILFEISPLIFPNIKNNDALKTIRHKHKSLYESVIKAKEAAEKISNFEIKQSVKKRDL